MKKRGFKLGLAIASLAGVSTMLASCMAELAEENIRFDSSIWKAANTGDETRCQMVADLQDRVGLKGLTRAEVVERLGQPEKHDDASLMHYHLCPSFMDIYILELKFKDGRVLSARVRDT